MSRALIANHPGIRKYTTVWMDTLRDGQSALVNTNKLIRFYPGATGLKTGSTGAARYCLSATAEKERHGAHRRHPGRTHLSPSGSMSAKTLLNYGFFHLRP
jgi:D-alanyl-D-alanine carboxypeptidase (penicillin-binding protein 5/6)